MDHQIVSKEATAPIQTTPARLARSLAMVRRGQILAMQFYKNITCISEYYCNNFVLILRLTASVHKNQVWAKVQEGASSTMLWLGGWEHELSDCVQGGVCFWWKKSQKYFSEHRAGLQVIILENFTLKLQIQKIRPPIQSCQNNCWLEIQDDPRIL